MTMARFYCGLAGEMDWNHHIIKPGPYACISPVYGRSERTRRVNRTAVPAGTQVIQDSGAFSDGPRFRLSYEEALERQIKHADDFGYADMLTHRASYDLLIDEKWTDGRRLKSRWTEDNAKQAVKTTVQAAEYLVDHRNGLSLILSAQGVSARQYLECAKEIAPLLQESDVFGLGGWCITGLLQKVMRPIFQQTMHLVIPYLGSAGVKWVHIWGVIYPEAIGELQYICDEYGIRLSTDSTGPSLNPIRGEWGYAEWRNNQYSVAPIMDSCRVKTLWEKAPVCPAGTCCRGLERARHVEETSKYIENIHLTKHYHPAWIDTPRQLTLV